MQTIDLVYVGFLKRVAALHRSTGEIVWQWEADKGASYLTLLVDNDIVIVSVDGYMYGLDAATGRELWFNPMRGFKTGVASLAIANHSAQNTQANARAHAATTAAQQALAQQQAAQSATYQSSNP
jgi:outer membrane protein assembly factor BamB